MLDGEGVGDQVGSDEVELAKAKLTAGDLLARHLIGGNDRLKLRSPAADEEGEEGDKSEGEPRAGHVRSFQVAAGVELATGVVRDAIGIPRSAAFGKGRLQDVVCDSGVTSVRRPQAVVT